MQCQACGKSMSAKKLTYNHAGYCIKRVQEVDKPKAIPMPQKIIPTLENILPVKAVKQDVESDDHEAECFKHCILPSEITEINAMTKVKNKSQRLNNNISQTLISLIYPCIKLQMYKELKIYYHQHMK